MGTLLRLAGHSSHPILSSIQSKHTRFCVSPKAGQDNNAARNGCERMNTRRLFVATNIQNSWESAVCVALTTKFFRSVVGVRLAEGDVSLRSVRGLFTCSLTCMRKRCSRPYRHNFFESALVDRFKKYRNVLKICQRTITAGLTPFAFMAIHEGHF